MRKRTLDFVLVSLTLCLLLATTAVLFLREAGERNSAVRFVGVSAHIAEPSAPSYVAAASKASADSSVSETPSKTPESAIASASVSLPSLTEKMLESRVRATIPLDLPLQPAAAAVPVQPEPPVQEDIAYEAPAEVLPEETETTAAPIEYQTTAAPTEPETTPQPETVLPETQTLPTEAPTEPAPPPQLPVEPAPPAAPGVSFQTPGTMGATAYNFGIVASLLQRNGAQNYLSYSDNGNGTISVDGVTLPVAGAPFSWKTTCYDGHECARVNNFAYGDVNTTAMGLIPARGMVAAAIGGFDFGTVLFVEGYGLCVVADRHGMGNEFLDLAMDPYEIENGVILPTQHRKIYVISIP